MIMKSAGHILLAVMYCVVMVGMSVSTHYCGTIPVGSHLGASTAEPSTCCGENEAESDCCTTVITTLIVTDDHTASAHEFSAPVDATILPLSPEVQVPAPDLCLLHQPTVFPPGTAPPLTILHSCFLI
jgi:hypothetical protein